jgi:hypothetical protein
MERHALVHQEHELLPLVLRVTPRRLEVLAHVGHDLAALGTLQLVAVYVAQLADGMALEGLAAVEACPSARVPAVVAAH